ncbi:putative uncharacterized protein [Parachlamydia acanthamoebae UV-7]|uniref:Citrate transporter-like domain-containing protein n=2 Tax=Parachlamydia acanthamoebae TaxID=83552 RepID=F8L2B8_PARAV|nr:SLC13 family permease [Parachlamydia acanthamoebae]CCB87431.1 putative uncharacterized protein [Parachlamydia acanthamoebae UV-7]
MEIAAFTIFFLVYLGMILGFWPGLALDRTGIALLGAIAFIELQGTSITEASNYVDLPALSMLFSFMIISAQFYYSGFYTSLIHRMEKCLLSPPLFLLLVILISAILSAVLINDIVCLALSPLIIKVCFRKQLNPIPFLIGLACSSNIGSAFTLIGNPQNVLIGQVLNIPFVQYLQFAFIPCLLSLAVTWWIIKLSVQGNWFQKGPEVISDSISYDFWQSCKGIFVLILLLIAFFFTSLPRDQISLAAAGFLLLSRRMASQTMLNFIDWQLLVLFIGLFIVNRSFLNMHEKDFFPHLFEQLHLDLASPIPLITLSAILSNVISNVPAVMLILPFVHTPLNGTLLALSSTLAGNLCLVGSIANLIVISQAQVYGIKIDWKKHMRVGLPITLASFIILLGWMSWML